MRKKWLSRTVLPLFAATFLGVFLVGTALTSADDVEDPAFPPGGSSCVMLPLGDLALQACDVSGSAIDAKDALEPQATAMMLTSDVSLSPGQTLGAQTSPTFETWAQ